MNEVNDTNDSLRLTGYFSQESPSFFPWIGRVPFSRVVVHLERLGGGFPVYQPQQAYVNF